MGSATTNALAAAGDALAAAPGVDLAVARDLFVAARAIGDTPQLSGALADSAAAQAARAKVVADVFGPSLSPVAVTVLTAVVAERWSNASDLVDGVDELAVRAASIAAPQVDLEGELFQFSRTIAGNPELELALGSRLGDPSAKGVLVESLLNGRVSDATSLVVSSLVQRPRGRRVRQLLSRAIGFIADQRGRAVATVVSAVPLTDGQLERLAAALTQRYGTPVSVNTVVDPAIVGGLRVQIADDVIDASVSSRLADLRQRLAG